MPTSLPIPSPTPLIPTLEQWLLDVNTRFAANRYGKIDDADFRAVFEGAAQVFADWRHLSVKRVKGATYPVPYTDNLGLVPADYRILGMQAEAVHGVDSATGAAGVTALPVFFALIRDSRGPVDALLDAEPATILTVKAKWVQISGTQEEKLAFFEYLVLEDRDYAAGDVVKWEFAGGETRLIEWIKDSVGFQHPEPTGEDDDPIYRNFAPLSSGTSYDDSAIQAAVATLAEQVDAAAADKEVLRTELQAAIKNLKSELVGGAPGALDALNELAAALGNDANFSATVLNSLELVRARVVALEAFAAQDANVRLSSHAYFTSLDTGLLRGFTSSNAALAALDAELGSQGGGTGGRIWLTRVPEFHSLSAAQVPGNVIYELFGDSPNPIGLTLPANYVLTVQNVDRVNINGPLSNVLRVQANGRNTLQNGRAGRVQFSASTAQTVIVNNFPITSITKTGAGTVTLLLQGTTTVPDVPPAGVVYVDQRNVTVGLADSVSEAMLAPAVRTKLNATGGGGGSSVPSVSFLARGGGFLAANEVVQTIPLNLMRQAGQTAGTGWQAGSSQYIVPVSGTYDARGSMQFSPNGPNANSTLYGLLNVNGVDYQHLFIVQCSQLGVYYGSSAAVELDLVAGDVVDLRTWNNAGGGNIQSDAKRLYFSMRLIA